MPLYPTDKASIDITPYLADTAVINWQHEAVLQKAKSLAKDIKDPLVVIKNCFEFVRGEIKHSWDYQMGPVTCKASEVLEHGTGFCYPKSHLLAALLRANNIPTALCYQRLSLNDDGAPYCLHGLNAVYLTDIEGLNNGWYRLDPRGNKEGLTSDFNPPQEILPFKADLDGEANFPEVHAEPHPGVLKKLNQYTDFTELANDLPDVQVYL